MGKISIFKPAIRIGLILCIVAVLLGLVSSALAAPLAAPTGQTIWLRANANNQYVSADQNLANTQLVANRGSVQAWEQFVVVDAGGGLIALRASNGRYVSADSGLAAYAPLVANRTAIGGWEKFQWIDVSGGQVRLIAQTNGRYVAADLNRSAYLVADRTSASTWETFTWGSGGGTPPPTTPPPATTPPPPGWRLVWSDEFSGTSVNTSNWNFQTGCSGWGNNEWEDYTSGANAVLSNGVLNIEARIKPGTSLARCNVTSIRMNTQGKRSWQYGRMEARLAIPMGQGLWPAFWMMGNSGGWPMNGEIDIMEHINNETQTHGVIHWDNGGHVQYGGTAPNSSVSSFHVYAIEWDASAIRWFVDSNNFVTANIANGINGTSEFHQPFYFLLNLAVGGNWPGSPNSSTPFPSRYQIDYVRVYQR